MINASKTNSHKTENMTPTSLMIFFLLFAPFIFVDATAASSVTSSYDHNEHHHDSSMLPLPRQFKEEDYKAIMTNYLTDQGYLRGRK